MQNRWNNCRLCQDRTVSRPLFRYGIRHYCHAECGLEKWGTEFLNKIPNHEIGSIPYRALENYPQARALAEALYRVR